MLYASANGDANKQVDKIQQLTAQKPDAMVVVPMGPGITGQVRAAANQDIPVVLCAGRLEGNAGAISTVARSYELQATLWAEWLVKQLPGGKGRIAMLSGIAGVPTAEYQKAAAEEVFAKHPDIEIVSKQYTDWSPTPCPATARCSTCPRSACPAPLRPSSPRSAAAPRCACSRPCETTEEPPCPRSPRTRSACRAPASAR